MNDGSAESLRATLRGPVLQPGDAGYDDARKVYNAMIDRHPRLIARCADVADVIAAVGFAREHDMLLAVRGGGHNGAGLGVCDDGLVLDLSSMDGVRVDPAERTVRVEGGCTWGRVDHATHAFGLAAPSGIISTTGVGGLTLGGGMGYLSRKYGLSIDNLLEADVVLADGQLVKASEREHADLFWALRGGGGNFGVVTSFLFRLHPVDQVVGGPTLWDLDDATKVMRWYRDFIAAAQEELNGWFGFVTVPPAAPFPETLWGRKMCAVVWCYVGAPDRADAIFAPIAAFGPPALHGVHAMPFPMLQSAFDKLYPPGHQWYWRADFVDELSDAAIELHKTYASRLPTPQSSMHLYPVDGAVHRVGPDETAFAHRRSRWASVIVGVDPDPANAALVTDWTKRYHEALHPYSAGAAYVNFLMDEGQERVRSTYGENYARLAAVKARYDPGNVFRVNQNVRPATAEPQPSGSRA